MLLKIAFHQERCGLVGLEVKICGQLVVSGLSGIPAGVKKKAEKAWMRPELHFSGPGHELSGNVGGCLVWWFALRQVVIQNVQDNRTLMKKKKIGPAVVYTLAGIE